MAISSEQKKQIAAGVLGVLALGAITWSLFFSDDSTARSSQGKTATAKPGITTAINPDSAKESSAAKPNVMLVSQPLDLGGLSEGTGPVIGRNIFIYPPPPPSPSPPPPAPPTPTPPPPPITLAGLNPSQVLARTAGGPVTVFGAKIPADAKVFINGAQYPTTYVNESQVKVDIPAATIANPGQIQVEVKGASDPAKWYSNRLTLNITPPPIPDYKYLGYILKNGVSTAVIRESSESELRNVRIGTKLGSYWQITKIDDKAIEIIDLRINVRHSLPLSGEGG